LTRQKIQNADSMFEICIRMTRIEQLPVILRGRAKGRWRRVMARWGVRKEDVQGNRWESQIANRCSDQNPEYGIPISTWNLFFKFRPPEPLSRHIELMARLHEDDSRIVRQRVRAVDGAPRPLCRSRVPSERGNHDRAKVINILLHQPRHER